MQVEIPVNVVQKIEKLMATGRFESVTELFDTALEILSDSELESEEYVEYLRREVEIGLREEKQGLFEPLDMKEIIAECRAKAGLPPSSP